MDKKIRQLLAGELSVSFLEDDRELAEHLILLEEAYVIITKHRRLDIHHFPEDPALRLSPKVHRAIISTIRTIVEYLYKKYKLHTQSKKSAVMAGLEDLREGRVSDGPDLEAGDELATAIGE